MGKMKAIIESIKDRVPLFKVTSLSVLVVLVGMYFHRTLGISVEENIHSVFELAFSIFQIILIFAIAINMYQLVRKKGLLMRFGAISAIFLIALIGIMNFVSFFHLDKPFFLKLHHNADFLIFIYSLIVMLFFSFFGYIDVLDQREKVYSAFAITWNAIVLYILFGPAIGRTTAFVSGFLVLITSFSLIIVSYFYGSRIKLPFPIVSYGLFMILLFNSQFGYFSRVYFPLSLGVLIAQFSAVLAYIFGFWALVMGIAVLPRERMERELIERGKIITSIQSIVRHDTMNYLASAIGFMEISKDANSLDFINNAIGSLEKAKLLLDMTTDATKQFIDVEKKIVPLYPILISICDEIYHDRESYEKEQIEININIGQIKVYSHPLIAGAIRNIIENTLKYTPGVNVRIDITSSIESENDLIFANLIFEDYGQGVHPTLMEKLLKKPVSSKKGHGFGLFMYNFLIEKILEGRINIENRVDDDYTQGTRVILSIPLP